jgi:hypothetical protein
MYNKKESILYGIVITAIFSFYDVTDVDYCLKHVLDI